MPTPAIVVSTSTDCLLDSILTYQCPDCFSEYQLESDAGEIICEGCGLKIDCNIMTMNFADEEDF